MTELEKPRRGRPPKNLGDEGDSPTMERRERRRKDGAEQNAGLRLAIPEWVYDRYPKKNYSFCWFVDDAANLDRRYNDDWDPVDGVEPVPGASDRHGRPAKNVLYVKRGDWVQEDRMKLEEKRRNVEQQMRRGKVTGRGDDAGQTLAEQYSYADEANRLR